MLIVTIGPPPPPPTAIAITVLLLLYILHSSAGSPGKPAAGHALRGSLDY
jgi:hypothetical protein